MARKQDLEYINDIRTIPVKKAFIHEYKGIFQDEKNYDTFDDDYQAFVEQYKKIYRIDNEYNKEKNISKTYKCNMITNKKFFLKEFVGRVVKYIRQPHAIYFITQTYDDKYGIIDQMSRIVFPNEFDAFTFTRIPESCHDVVLVCKDKKEGIFRLNGNKILDCIYDKIDIKDSLYINLETSKFLIQQKVKNSDLYLWGVIDNKGNTLLNYQFDFDSYNRKYGFAKKTNQQTQHFLLLTDTKNNQIVYLNLQNDNCFVTKEEYEQIEKFHNIINKKRKEYLINGVIIKRALLRRMSDKSMYRLTIMSFAMREALINSSIKTKKRTRKKMKDGQ